MKFEIYKFKTVTSTNDVAADLIKNKNKSMDVFMLINKQKVEELKARDGFQKKEIYSDLFFFL